MTKTRISPLTPKQVSELTLKGWGIESIHYPKMKDTDIVQMVHEVAERLGVMPPEILLHSKSVMATAYYHQHGMLLLSDRSLSVFTPDEFKALIAHELDHHENARHIFNMDAAKEKLKAKGPAKKEILKQATRRFSDFIEGSADDRAMREYGAEATLSCQTKILIEGAMDNPVFLATLFPEIAKNNLPAIDRTQVTQRITDMVNGEYHPKDGLVKSMQIRLKKIQDCVQKNGRGISPGAL